MFSPIQGQALLPVPMALEAPPEQQDRLPLSVAQESADVAPDDWPVASELEPKSGAVPLVSRAQVPTAQGQRWPS